MFSKKDLATMTNAYEVVKTCEEFRRSYNFKPDREKFPYPKVGDILDEDKSVKWNREEVERLRAAFGAETQRLNKEFYAVVNALESRAKELLADEYELSEEEMEIVWAKAYEDGHGYGVVEVYNYFVDLVDYFVRFKKAKRRKKDTSK